MLDALVKIIPIVCLILIGYTLQVKKLVQDQTMAEIKKGIIQIALPAVLFIAFKDMALKKEYIIISLIVMVMMVLFYMAGALVDKLFRLDWAILPFLTTGFAFGLLGIPLFGGVYGLENVGTLSILGVGHEFFAWFIYLTLVKSRFNNEGFKLSTVISFMKSPVILAILSGIFVNIANLNPIINKVFLLKGLELTLVTIAGLTTPLILIIIGYGIRLQKVYINKGLQIVAIRLVVVFGIGYLMKWLFFDPILKDTLPLFNMAYFTFLVLPPPFMFAIYVGNYSTKENEAIVNNAIVLSTILCVLLFAGAVVIGL